jgi:hypothetical protein
MVKASNLVVNKNERGGAYALSREWRVIAVLSRLSMHFAADPPVAPRNPAPYKPPERHGETC